MTLDQLGEKAGISGNTVARIESGDTSPRIDQLMAMAAALGTECTIHIVEQPAVPASAEG